MQIIYNPEFTREQLNVALIATSSIAYTHDVSFFHAFDKSFDSERTAKMFKEDIDGEIVQPLLEVGPDQLMGRKTHGWYVDIDGALRHTEITQVPVEFRRESNWARYQVRVLDVEYELFHTAQAAAQKLRRNLNVTLTKD